MNDLWRENSYLKLEIEYLNKGVFCNIPSRYYGFKIKSKEILR